MQANLKIILILSKVQFMAIQPCEDNNEIRLWSGGGGAESFPNEELFIHPYLLHLLLRTYLPTGCPTKHDSWRIV